MENANKWLKTNLSENKSVVIQRWDRVRGRVNQLHQKHLDAFIMWIVTMLSWVQSYVKT